MSTNSPFPSPHAYFTPEVSSVKTYRLIFLTSETRKGVFGAHDISDVNPQQQHTTIEPRTGLPMNVEKYGAGTGGTDGYPAIQGFRGDATGPAGTGAGIGHGTGVGHGVGHGTGAGFSSATGTTTGTGVGHDTSVGHGTSTATGTGTGVGHGVGHAPGAGGVPGTQHPPTDRSAGY